MSRMESRPDDAVVMREDRRTGVSGRRSSSYIGASFGNDDERDFRPTMMYVGFERGGASPARAWWFGGKRERDDAMNCSRISSPRVSCGEVTRTITASERVGSREGGARWRSLPMFIHLSFLRLSGTEKASKAEKTNTYPTRAISLKTWEIRVKTCKNKYSRSPHGTTLESLHTCGGYNHQHSYIRSGAYLT